MIRTCYGPIDSWRFGYSLGIDPLAAKTKMCPFSCTYCQYGPTRPLVLRRRVFITAARLQADLASLGTISADCITFAGLGEPTLAANLADLLDVVRQACTLPIILLTGSGLLSRQDVRRDMMAFDTVAVKLDAPDERLFRQINHPGRGISFSAMVAGVRHFRRVYSGHLVLQMMFLQANKQAAQEMAALARSLAPDEVQLNTPLQPALGGPVHADEMLMIEKAFAGLPVRSVYAEGQAQIKPRFF